MPYQAIARAFLAGEPTVEQLIERATRVVGKPARWITRAARRFVKDFPPHKTRPRQREVVEFLRRFRSLRKISVEEWLTESQRMRPASAAAGWPVPAIETAGALAGWLQLDLRDLEWFADLRGLNRKASPQ